ncbi:MAG: SAM-dependent methyltransferase [Ruminococcaceae bacterium]|nr:SAM-dependent methyltransferase [Oscillospiraceae bacterium]
MSSTVKLSPRLSACADLVQSGKRLADVGCDHGYVPVSLVLDGKIKSAVACDINEGPLKSCISLVKDFGLEDKIRCVISDGLKSVDENEVDEILLAGMGGELIADILNSCAYTVKKHVIINAMTHPEIARKWLYNNGFRILNDFVVPDGRHHYSVFDAVYCGEYTYADDVKCFLGEINDFSDREYFLHLLSYLKNKQKGGTDYSAVITAIEEKI